MKKSDYIFNMKNLACSLFFLFAFSANSLFAQMVCEPFLQVFPDSNDQVELTIDDLLSSTVDLNLNYITIARQPNGMHEGSGLNKLTIRNASSIEGIFLNDTVRVNSTGEACGGRILIGPFAPFGCNSVFQLNITANSLNEVRITPEMVLVAPHDLTRTYEMRVIKNRTIIGAGTNEAIVSNADQYAGTVIVEIIDVATGDKCSHVAVILNPNAGSGGLICKPTFEVFPNQDCAVGYFPWNIAASSIDPSHGFLGNVFNDRGEQLQQYSDYINLNDLSLYDDLELLSIAININTGDSCSTRLIIRDTIPPVPVCHNMLEYTVDVGQRKRITPFLMDAGSYDNCTYLPKKIYLVDSLNNPTTVPEDEIWLPSETRIHRVALQVTDREGNANVCIGNVSIIVSGNTTLTCNDNINISTDNNCEIFIVPDMILEGFFTPSSFQIQVTDCNGNPIHTAIDTLLFPNAGDFLGDSLCVSVTDTQNGLTCWAVINIEDKLAPVPICEIVVAPTSTGQVTIYPGDIDEGSYDNCGLITFQIAEADLQGNPIGPYADSLIIGGGVASVHDILLLVTDGSGNENSCLTSVWINGPTQVTQTITGNVFEDIDADCAFDTGEPGIDDWSLVAIAYPSNSSQIFQPDAQGAFSIPLSHLSNDSLLKVFLLSPMNITRHCTSVHCFDLNTVTGNVNADFAIQTTRIVQRPDCPMLVVDVSTSHLTRCQSSVYTVNYCNYGNSEAEDSKVEVTFDPWLTVTDSDLPSSTIDGQTYSFDLGTVERGECQSFNVSVDVSCNAKLGQSHLVSAVISPNEFCTDPDPNWSGASIEVEGECIQDSVVFVIRNVGTEDMIQERNFIVIEDIILHKSKPFNLLAGSEIRLSAHGKGNTCRLEAEQVPGHPGLSNPTATVEGCGTRPDGSVSFGFYTQYPQDDENVFRSFHVRENEELTSPAELVALPKGVDNQHFIKSNTDIEYLVRFQNDNDEPYGDVNVEANLPAELLFATVVPGASSHGYRFEVNETGKINFVFEKINLQPNEWAYVKYRVSQKSDLPKGTMIFNKADISFDGSTFVETNQTFHEVSDDFLTVSQVVQLDPTINLTVAPNPFVNQAVFTIDALEGITQELQFQLIDVNGKLIRNESFFGNQFTLERNGLPTGVYFFSILSENGVPLTTGKIATD